MITLNELLTGKATVIKNKTYFETKKYVQPFIDRMSAFTKDFRINVKMPEQMTIGKEDADVTFNKVSIIAVLDNKIDKYNEVIGFCYALDVRKPVAKFYRAYIDLETNIMFATNPNMQICQAIEPEEPINYSGIKSLMELTDDTKVKMDTLDETEVDKQSLDRILGSWVRKCRGFELYSEFGKVKLAASNGIDAFEMIFEDRESDFYCDEDVNVNALTCYEALAKTVADDTKDLINKFEKSIIISKIV